MMGPGMTVNIWAGHGHLGIKGVVEEIVDPTVLLLTGDYVERYKVRIVAPKDIVGMICIFPLQCLRVEDVI